MKTLLILLLVVTVSAEVIANPDYSIDVRISTIGTNVTYSLRKGPVPIAEIQKVVKEVAALSRSQTVHIIADEKTSMASLFTVSKSVHDAGLTNIIVSVFCSEDTSTQSNGVVRIAGMSLAVYNLHDFELQEIKPAQPSDSSDSEKAAESYHFGFKPGFYEAGHPQEDALWDALGKSSVTITLSGHAGITLPAKKGKGWDNNLSLEQLKKRLEGVSDIRQAIILEEKNFTGQDQLDQKVSHLLKKLGFKTIIIQVCHGQGTVIKEVITN
jgi:biopolymer transport protein ExbD